MRWRFFFRFCSSQREKFSNDDRIHPLDCNPKPPPLLQQCHDHDFYFTSNMNFQLQPFSELLSKGNTKIHNCLNKFILSFLEQLPQESYKLKEFYNLFFTGFFYCIHMYCTHLFHFRKNFKVFTFKIHLNCKLYTIFFFYFVVLVTRVAFHVSFLFQKFSIFEKCIFFFICMFAGKYDEYTFSSFFFAFWLFVGLYSHQVVFYIQILLYLQFEYRARYAVLYHHYARRCYSDGENV